MDLVPERLRRRQPRLDRRPGPCGRCEHAVRQELRRVDQLLEPVLPRTGGAAARERAERVRLAVCLWHGTRGRGEPRRPGRGRRRRLSGDRRRVRIRRPLRRGADLHRRPARQDRRPPTRWAWPPSPTSTTTPRFPTRCSSGRTEPSSTRRRCTGRTSATRSTPIYANTYIANRIYGRPIFPLGQTYESPSAPNSLRFREEAVRLRRHRRVLLGLAGNPHERLDRAGDTACAAEQRHPEPELPRTDAGQPRAIRCCGCRSTSPARSPRRPRPASSNRDHDGQPRALPVRPRHRRRAARPKPPPGRRCWPSRRSPSTGPAGDRAAVSASRETQTAWQIES